MKHLYVQGTVMAPLVFFVCNDLNKVDLFFRFQTNSVHFKKNNYEVAS